MLTSNSAFGGQFLARGGQPPVALRLALGAPADQAADQLLPGRRLQEDEQRVGHGRPRTCRAPWRSISSIAGLPRRQGQVDRLARRAVAGDAVHDRPLQQVAVGDHPVELLVGDEPVVHAVDLTRPRLAGGRGHRDPDLGVVLADVGGDAALADGRGTGQHDEPAVPLGLSHGARWLRPELCCSDASRSSLRSVARHGSSDASADGRDRPADRPRPRRYASQLRHRTPFKSRHLLGAETAHPAALGDAEPLHGLPGADLAEAGHGLQQVDDPHLADDLVLLALSKHVGDRGAGVLEPVLHLGAFPSRGRGLFEGRLSLFGSERGQSHVRGPSCYSSHVGGSVLLNIATFRRARQSTRAASPIWTTAAERLRR